MNAPQIVNASQVASAHLPAVCIGWDPQSGDTQMLHLSDGTIVPLTEIEYECLKRSINNITWGARHDVRDEFKRSTNSPQLHGLIKRDYEYNDLKSHDGWRSSDHPDGPVVTYLVRDSAWHLTLPEHGPLTLQNPVDTAAWDDSEGLRELCVRAGDPEAVRLVAASAWPEQVAKAAKIRANDAEWEALTESSPLHRRIVRENAERFELEGNPSPHDIKFFTISVRRHDLNLPTWGGWQHNDAAWKFGVEVRADNREDLTEETRQWVEALTQSGRWKVTAVHSGDRLFIVRNEQIFRRAEAAGVIEFGLG